jgi:hypothetical protein
MNKNLDHFRFNLGQIVYDSDQSDDETISDETRYKTGGFN